MPGEELDKMLDTAMSNDKFDYGDTEPAVTTETDPNAVEPDVGAQQTQTPEQQMKVQEDKGTPGQVPKVPAAQPGQQQPIDTTQLKRVGAMFADAKGNIVDKTGKIVARSGESARHWQEASRANAQVTNLTRQLEMQGRQMQQNTKLVEQAREIAEMPQRLGVSREDYTEGIALMAKWRANPVEVAREIVARTLTFGHNVSDILGKSAGDALEMRAITQLVNKTTAPIEQQREQAAREAQNTQRSEEMHNAFINKFPDAEIHGEAIASLIGKGVAPEVAYYQVQNFALREGLDFSQPLGPQIVARQQGGVQRQTVQRVAAPMPNGGRGNERNPNMQPAFAEPGDDWSSIIRNAMQE